jgi:hypothetical protein
LQNEHAERQAGRPHHEHIRLNWRKSPQVAQQHSGRRVGIGLQRGPHGLKLPLAAGLAEGYG